MNGLDLFSGIGGISLALAPWVRTVAYCERDRYAQSVLLSRMRDGHLDRAPIWDDVTTLRGAMLPPIDILFGGFPCTDISVAGRGLGLAGEHSGLYFEILRLLDETKPRFVFLENVPAIRTRGLNTVAETLAERGFDFRWTVLSAADVGAPHLRKRWWLLAAHPDRLGLRHGGQRSSQGEAEASDLAWHDGSPESLAHAASNGRDEGKSEPARIEGGSHSSFSGGPVAHAHGERLEEHGSRQGDPHPEVSRGGGDHWGREWWATEPNLGRVANGVPSRVDRIRCLGNAVVPLQAREAFRRLAGLA